MTNGGSSLDERRLRGLSTDARDVLVREPKLREASEKAVEMAVLVNEDRVVTKMRVPLDGLAEIVSQARAMPALMDDLLRNSVFVVVSVLCLLPAMLALLAEGVRVGAWIGLPFGLVALLSFMAFIHQMWSWARCGHSPALASTLHSILSSTVALGEKAVYVSWDADADGSARVGLIDYGDLLHVDALSTRSGTRLVLRGKDLVLEVERALTEEQVEQLVGAIEARRKSTVARGDKS